MDTSISLTPEIFRKYPWQDEIDACPEKQDYHYFSRFSARAEEAKLNGDLEAFRLYQLLSFVAYCFRRFDDQKEPFAPADGSGGPSPARILSGDLEVLRIILEEIRDPEFRALVADILWEYSTPRNPLHAEIGARAYLESVAALESKSLWPPRADRLKRARHLAAMLGKDKDLFAEVTRSIEAVVDKAQHQPESGLFCLALLELLSGDDLRFATTCERLAVALETTGEWDFASRYWVRAARYFQALKDSANQRRAELAAAECHVQNAEKILRDGKLGASGAAGRLSRAVQALKKAKAEPERIRAVHQRLLAVQELATSELKPLTLSEDQVPGIREAFQRSFDAAVAHVSGRPFQEAVLRLAWIREPVDPKEVRKAVEKSSEKFVFMSLFPAVAISGSGQVADRSSSIRNSQGEVREKALRDAMLIQCKSIYWHTPVYWALDPARRQILFDHPTSLSDLEFLVADNAFIPPGHEGIYHQGIHAGFHGDLVTAMHLLIPQIEASIRMVFQQHGIVTSTLESDLTQGERDLGWLLTHPQMDEFFGDYGFNLRGILIDRFGYNLRNNMAHGLIPEGGFYSTGALYLWWLILGLLCRGYRFTSTPDDESVQQVSVPEVSTEADITLWQEGNS